MQNVINYYYNLKPDQINNFNNYYYYFYLNNELYHFIIYPKTRKEEEPIYNLSKSLSNNLVHQIILNKNNNVVTLVNNTPYILYKIYININKKISLPEINYLNNLTINYDKSLIRDNWDILWSKKIDYFEYQINQIGKKYPI